MAKAKVTPGSLADLEACTNIYNHWVADGVSTFDEYPRSPGEAIVWYEQHQDPAHPFLVLKDDSGVVGFGSLSPWSKKSGYRQTVEVSVFLAPECLGAGGGKQLLSALVAAANERKHHLLVARIEASNQTSVAVFRKAGFEPVGLMREAGFKKRRWLDVYVMEKVLSRRAKRS